MKCLVTGGAGFIGSNLVEELLKKHDVNIIDNLSSGYKKNINENAKCYLGEISEKKILDSALKDVDILFHHAAQVSVIDSIKNPTKNWKINVLDTEDLIKCAIEKNVKKIIFASSSAVYGETSKIPVSENDITKPISPYGKSKLEMEKISEKYSEKIDCICLRYFNVYGPRQNPNGEYSAVVPKFINNIVNGKKITIYGDGKQTRDFIYVEDIIKANLLFIKKNERFGIYNVGTGIETNLLELISTIEEKTGKKTEIEYKKERENEIKRSVADISKIKKIGFEPISINEGIEKTIKKEYEKF